jgi:hypothetical protein
MEITAKEILEKHAKDFFLWLVRKAKIEVIEAEQFIEAHGFAEAEGHMVPVLTLDELYQIFLKDAPQSEKLKEI